MTVFEFLDSRSGGDLLRLLEGVVTIVAAVLSGSAARNAREAKNLIGGPIERTLGQVLRGFFRRGPAHERLRPVKVLDKPLTVEQKIDALQVLTEKLWLRQGLETKTITERLDRVDPPTRRH